MKDILRSPDNSSVSPVLYEAIHRRFGSGSVLLKRFVRCLESDIIFSLRQKHDEKQQTNLAEALGTIREISIEKDK